MIGSGSENGLLIALAESRIRAEHARHQKIEDAPQLTQPVFDRRAGKRETVMRLQPLHRLGDFRRMVLNVLRLIERHAVECAAVVFVDVTTQQII